jgi:hypothetical protein
MHEAVGDCVQFAIEEDGRAAEFIFRHVQELIGQGWRLEDAELVGARAIGVLNAMRQPPSPGVWG